MFVQIIGTMTFAVRSAGHAMDIKRKPQCRGIASLLVRGSSPTQPCRCADCAVGASAIADGSPAHPLAHLDDRSALIQQQKLASVTQICQSRLALAVPRRSGYELEIFAQRAVFAIYLPFDRLVPKGSIADEQRQGCPHYCGADKHGLLHPTPHSLLGTDHPGSSRNHGVT